MCSVCAVHWPWPQLFALALIVITVVTPATLRGLSRHVQGLRHRTVGDQHTPLWKVLLGRSALHLGDLEVMEPLVLSPQPREKVMGCLSCCFLLWTRGRLFRGSADEDAEETWEEPPALSGAGGGE